MLLLGEFVSSSTLSLLAGALFPNSFVSLSFSTIPSLLLFILSILLPFYEWFQCCRAVTVNLHFFKSVSGPAPSSILFSIVICRRDVTIHELWCLFWGQLFLRWGHQHSMTWLIWTFTFKFLHFYYLAWFLKDMEVVKMKMWWSLTLFHSDCYGYSNIISSTLSGCTKCTSTLSLVLPAFTFLFWSIVAMKTFLILAAYFFPQRTEISIYFSSLLWVGRQNVVVFFSEPWQWNSLICP